MFRRFSVSFAVFSIILDVIAVLVSLAAAVSLKPLLDELLSGTRTGSLTGVPRALYPASALVWTGILLLLSIYEGRRNLRAVDEFTTLTIGSVLATISLAGLLYFSYPDLPRAVFLNFILLSYLIMILWRTGVRMVFRYNEGEPLERRRVLIVGAGPVGRELQAQIVRNSYLGFEIAGFLDEDPQKKLQHEDVLGCLQDAKAVVETREVDDVVIAMPQADYKGINNLIADLHSLPVKTWVIPDYFQLALHNAVIEEFAGLTMLELRAPVISEYERTVKRFFDLVVTILLLPASLILMALIALAIRLEGPGPVIFRQKRVGENGQLFEILKFRTMVTGAEELRYLVEKVDGSGRLTFKTEKDPRVTRVGRILRRMSLDELPQLANILRGEMSLVGPRPELPYLVEFYEPWQRKRFLVPQGITGWWQVNGRSEKPMHLHIEDDLYYIQHYSLWLDIEILIKTIAVVLRGKGAY